MLDEACTHVPCVYPPPCPFATAVKSGQLSNDPDAVNFGDFFKFKGSYRDGTPKFVHRKLHMGLNPAGTHVYSVTTKRYYALLSTHGVFGPESTIDFALLERDREAMKHA
jgi:hypothetical protein